MMHAKSRALWQTAVYRSIDGTCVANQIARYAIVGHWGMLIEKYLGRQQQVAFSSDRDFGGQSHAIQHGGQTKP